MKRTKVTDLEIDFVIDKVIVVIVCNEDKLLVERSEKNKRN